MVDVAVFMRLSKSLKINTLNILLSVELWFGLKFWPLPTDTVAVPNRRVELSPTGKLHLDLKSTVSHLFGVY